MALRKNLKHQTKTISLDVPTESNLPARLKKISKQTGLSLFSLIQKWVLQEESLVGLVLYGKGQTGRPARVSKKAALEEAAGVKKQEKTAAAGPKSLPKTPKTPKTRGNKNVEYRNTLAKKIKKLKKEGMTLEKIAAAFNEGKVPTVSGTGKWYTSSISWLLKSAKAN